MKRFFILLCILLIAGYYCIMRINIYAHEEVHVQIQKYYGCVDSEVNYEWFGMKGSTECYEYKDRTQTARDMEYQLHSINEIYGYNISSLIYCVFMCTAIISVMIICHNHMGKNI